MYLFILLLSFLSLFLGLLWCWIAYLRHSPTPLTCAKNNLFCLKTLKKYCMYKIYFLPSQRYQMLSKNKCNILIERYWTNRVIFFIFLSMTHGDVTSGVCVLGIPFFMLCCYILYLLLLKVWNMSCLKNELSVFGLENYQIVTFTIIKKRWLTSKYAHIYNQLFLCSSICEYFWQLIINNLQRKC